MSRRRLFTTASNGSCSASKTSFSKRDRKFSGRCFCGLDVTLLQSGTTMNPGRWFVRCPKWKTSDCSYFVWVDEIEGEWDGFRRALSERKLDEDNPEANVDMKMLIKLGKIEAEVNRLRLWLVIVSFVVVFSLVSSVYLFLSRY